MLLQPEMCRRLRKANFAQGYEAISQVGAIDNAEALQAVQFTQGIWQILQLWTLDYVELQQATNPENVPRDLMQTWESLHHRLFRAMYRARKRWKVAQSSAPINLKGLQFHTKEANGLWEALQGLAALQAQMLQELPIGQCPLEGFAGTNSPSGSDVAELPI